MHFIYQILYTIILLSIFKENGQGLQQFCCKIPLSTPNLARHASADYSLFPKAKVLHTFQNQKLSSIIIILAKLIHLHYNHYVHNCNYFLHSLSYEKKNFPGYFQPEIYFICSRYGQFLIFSLGELQKARPYNKKIAKLILKIG